VAKSTTKLPQLESVPTPTDLSETGFITASAALLKKSTRPPFLLSTEGLPKTGQTSLMLTLPRPLYMFQLDMREEDALEKMPVEQQEGLYISHYSGDVPTDFTGLKSDNVSKFQEWVIDSILTPFSRDFKYAVKHARSIAIDKVSDLVELAQMGHFGKLEQNNQKQYAHPNAFVKNILRTAKDAGCIVFLSHELRDEYRDATQVGKDGREYIQSVRTGRWKRRGLSVNQMEHLVDTWGRMYRHDKTDVDDLEVETDEAKLRKMRRFDKTTFELKILGCAAEPGMNGERIEDPTWEKIAMMCKPSVTKW
jgi:hypothetical protein